MYTSANYQFSGFIEGTDAEFLMKDGSTRKPSAEQRPRDFYDENGVGVRNTLRMEESVKPGRPQHPMMGVITNDFPPFFHVTRPRDAKPVLLIEVASVARSVHESYRYEENYKLTGGQAMEEMRVNALGIFDSSAAPKRLDWSFFDNHEGLIGICDDLGNNYLSD